MNPINIGVAPRDSAYKGKKGKIRENPSTSLT